MDFNQYRGILRMGVACLALPPERVRRDARAWAGRADAMVGALRRCGVEVDLVPTASERGARRGRGWGGVHRAKQGARGRQLGGRAAGVAVNLLSRAIEPWGRDMVGAVHTGRERQEQEGRVRGSQGEANLRARGGRCWQCPCL